MKNAKSETKERNINFNTELLKHVILTQWIKRWAASKYIALRVAHCLKKMSGTLSLKNHANSVCYENNIRKNFKLHEIA